MKSRADDIGLTADILRGRQSVRATFRLPDRIINLLSIASTQLGVKQKALFDQLIEDSEVLSKVAEESERQTDAKKNEKRQKTFVLSRKSLATLEQVSEKYEIPRDLLVEISISRLVPVIDAEREKQKKREKIYREMIDYQEKGLNLLQKTGKTLGTRDPLFKFLERYLEQGERNLQEINQILEKGRHLKGE